MRGHEGQWRRQGVDMSTPLLLEVAPEIDTNPTRGRGTGGRSGRLRPQTPVIGSRSPCLSTPHILTWRPPDDGDICLARMSQRNALIETKQVLYFSRTNAVARSQRMSASVQHNYIQHYTSHISSTDLCPIPDTSAVKSYLTSRL